jgi:hypothetical protein
MTSIVESVADYLEDQGILTKATNLFVFTMPMTPHVCTAIIRTGGVEIPGEPTRRPSFQILHRNTNTASGSSMVNSINALLDDRWNILTTHPGRVEAQNEPGSWYKDENDHSVFPLNYVLTTPKPG